MNGSDAPVTPQAHPKTLVFILCAATFMGTLDIFIVNVGLHAIGRDLHEGSLAALSWILNAYSIIFACLLVPTGRLADRYGTKRTFLLGISIFSLASLGCALSDNVWLIVGLRVLQAAGAAALLPSSLGLILTAVAEERRVAAVRIWSVSGSIGAAAGPVVGGLLVQISWRWIFVVNVPVGALMVVLGTMLLPNTRHHLDERVPDLVGGLLLVLATGALALGLVQAPAWGWGTRRTGEAFLVALVAFVLFFVRTSRQVVPLIDFSLFKKRSFALSNLATLTMSSGFGLQLLSLVLWLEEAWRFSPDQTGLCIAPCSVMVSVTAIGLRRFTRKMRPHVEAALGTLFVAAGGVIVALSLGSSPHYFSEVLPAWLLMGIGTGLYWPVIVSAATADLEANQAATGSAVVQMMRQMGSVLGVACLVAVVGSQMATPASLSRFVISWWLGAAFALVGMGACLGLRTRGPGIETLAVPVGIGRHVAVGESG